MRIKYVKAKELHISTSHWPMETGMTGSEGGQVIPQMSDTWQQIALNNNTNNYNSNNNKNLYCFLCTKHSMKCFTYVVTVNARDNF